MARVLGQMVQRIRRAKVPIGLAEARCPRPRVWAPCPRSRPVARRAPRSAHQTANLPPLPNTHTLTPSRSQRVDAAGQQACFSCVSKAGFLTANSQGCSQCFYQWVPAPARAKCLACAQAAATPDAAKGVCAYCAAKAAGADACVSCLQSKRLGYAGDFRDQCVG
jgi:hypothetical protein